MQIYIYYWCTLGCKSKVDEVFKIADNVGVKSKQRKEKIYGKLKSVTLLWCWDV